VSTLRRLPIQWYRSWHNLALGIVATVLAVSALPAAATTGGIGLRLLDAPASGSVDPRALNYIVDHRSPGAVINRRIEASNSTDSAADIALYSSGATIDQGSFLGADGRTANELSTWTSVVPAAALVPAGRTIVGTVSVAVPADAAPGERYGVVWAEVRSVPGAGGGVTQVSRVGIRLYVSVGPGGAPAANFSIDSLTAERRPSGEPTVVASVHNTGGRALDMYGSLELKSGPGGVSAGPFPARLGTTLAIGATEPVSIALDKALPAGPWDARITLKSGLLEQSTGATITFPANGSAEAVATTSKTSELPRNALVLAGGGLAMVLALISFRRHRAPAAAESNSGLPVGALDLRPTVLLCDDEPDLRLLYRQVLEANGAIVVEAGSGEECLGIAEGLRPDLVLLDVVLPGKGGLDVLVELRNRYPLGPVVVMSGVLSDATRARSRELGAAESIEKTALVGRIPGLVERYRQTPLV
jgi:CheY-like chemotaxis protein